MRCRPKTTKSKSAHGAATANPQKKQFASNASVFSMSVRTKRKTWASLMMTSTGWPKSFENLIPNKQILGRPVYFNALTEGPALWLMDTKSPTIGNAAHGRTRLVLRHMQLSSALERNRVHPTFDNECVLFAISTSHLHPLSVAFALIAITTCQTTTTRGNSQTHHSCPDSDSMYLVVIVEWIPTVGCAVQTVSGMSVANALGNINVWRKSSSHQSFGRNVGSAALRTSPPVTHATNVGQILGHATMQQLGCHL